MPKMPVEKLLFSTATVPSRTRRMGGMKSKSILAALLMMSAIPGLAAGADKPLDFSYRVSGSAELRPLLVFNDGTDTFIQPVDPESKTVLVNGSKPLRQGAYFVVRGVAQGVTLVQGKESVQIAYSHAAPLAAVAATSSAAVDQLRQRALQGGRTDVQKGPEKQARDSEARIDGKNERVREETKECKPGTDRRESAFVVSFRGNGHVVSPLVLRELDKALTKVSSISSVTIFAEATSTTVAKRRAEAIRSAVIKSGISEERVHADTRSQTGIGSEVHVSRVVDIPCAASVVIAPSRKGSVTIIWDRDARELIEQIGKDLKVKSSVAGTERKLNVRIGIVDMPFDEAMTAVGRALGDDADIILRRDELVLRYKEK